jgi:hypothetical protein
MPYVFSEPVAWVLRYSDDPDASAAKFSDYYANSTVTLDDTKTACIKGLAFEGVTAEHVNALMAELARIGAKRLMYTRVRKVVRDGVLEVVPVTRTVPVKVKRPTA